MKKKLFTIDDIVVAFIAALGYGFGDTISRVSGWPDVFCMGASFVVGFTLQEIISRIAFSERVQRQKRNRIITYTTCFCIFIIAQAVSVILTGVSMYNYVMQRLNYVVVLPAAGFLLNMLIRGFRVRKIRKLYGDGSDGYVFDIKEKDIEEINRENRPITGRYNKKLAVKTRTGIYVGAKYRGALFHLGIPYAKAPTGDLRWRAPEELPSSEAVFEAVSLGASAVQVEHKGSILNSHRQSEDCLTLNICGSAQSSNTARPVLVIFHHGDFSYGGSADPLLYGTNFVKEHPDVLFVSFNYRLGIFGFIDFSVVPGGEAFPDALNLGLLDQIAALKWIRENIAAFGGDPDRITVMGFESGATSISMLSACEQANGLFKRAVVFNGHPGLAYETPEASRALAADLLRETDTQTMDELLKLDTETLKAAAQRLWMDMCSPTCDGKLIPSDVFGAYMAGAASGIEFIIGIPSNERQVYRSVLGEHSYEELISGSAAEIEKYMDASIEASVREYIESETASSNELEAKAKLIEQWNALLNYRSAAKLTEGGNKVYLLYWDEKPLIENLGSGTIDAAAALLGNGEASQMYGNVVNSDLSMTLQFLLDKFINGEAPGLYSNELKGVGAYDWKTFPEALIVSDGKISCDTIEDRITDVRGLMEYVVR